MLQSASAFEEKWVHVDVNCSSCMCDIGRSVCVCVGGGGAAACVARVAMPEKKKKVQTKPEKVLLPTELSTDTVQWPSPRPRMTSAGYTDVLWICPTTSRGISPMLMRGSGSPVAAVGGASDRWSDPLHFLRQQIKSATSTTRAVMPPKAIRERTLIESMIGRFKGFPFTTRINAKYVVARVIDTLKLGLPHNHH